MWIDYGKRIAEPADELPARSGHGSRPCAVWLMPRSRRRRPSRLPSTRAAAVLQVEYMTAEEDGTEGAKIRVKRLAKALEDFGNETKKLSIDTATLRAAWLSPCAPARRPMPLGDDNNKFVQAPARRCRPHRHGHCGIGASSAIPPRVLRLWAFSRTAAVRSRPPPP